MTNAARHKTNPKMGFWRRKYIRRFFYLLCLGVFTWYDFSNPGFLRRTFVFYTLRNETPAVEERMFPRLASQELEIRRYVEEVILGPVSPDCRPLFFRDTRLRSLLYREGVVYADLSEAAALPPLEEGPPKEGEVFRSLYTLTEGIRRNFPAVQEVRLFINGQRVQSLNYAFFNED